VNYILPFLRFSTEPTSFPSYAIDLSAGAPPQRLLTPAAAVSGPYLDTRAAVQTLQELAGLLQRGMLPAALREQGADRKSLIPVVDHLLRHWSDQAPVRKYRHHPVSGRVKAVWGMPSVQALLWGRTRENLLVWEVRNLSKGGLRVAVGPRDALEVGALVAVRAEDALTWHLGAVRRIERVAGESVLGVETLTMTPQAVHLQWSGGGCDGIALAAPRARISLLLPADFLQPRGTLQMSVDGAVFELSAGEAGEMLDDCRLLHFQVKSLAA